MPKNFDGEDDICDFYIHLADFPVSVNERIYDVICVNEPPNAPDSVEIHLPAKQDDNVTIDVGLSTTMIIPFVEMGTVPLTSKSRQLNKITLEENCETFRNIKSQ